LQAFGEGEAPPEAAEAEIPPLKSNIDTPKLAMEMKPEIQCSKAHHVWYLKISGGGCSPRKLTWQVGDSPFSIYEILHLQLVGMFHCHASFPGWNDELL